MPEFKIDSFLLSALISNMSTKGAEIATDSEVSNEGVDTLQTAVKYVSQQEKIVEVLELYKQLIAKDAGDIREMQGAATALDLTISNSFNMNLK